MLLRGYSQLDEEGALALPVSFQRYAGLTPGHVAEIELVRILGTGRKPHMVIHLQGRAPYISPQEVILLRGRSTVDERGRVFLAPDIRDAGGLETGNLIDLKVYGPAYGLWIVAHNRGALRATTLQIRLGRQKGSKKWQTVPLEY